MRFPISLPLFVGILVFTWWGLVPIFFKFLGHLNPFEVMAHRIVWSVVILGIFLISIKKLKDALVVLKNKKIAFTLFICAVFISADWALYIWAVNDDRILEASLGYFLNPLLAIFFGMVFFKEKSDFIDKFALFCAFVACSIEVVFLHKLPLVSIGLALLTNFYTIIRKSVYVSSLWGFFLETLLISPFAVIFLGIFYAKNGFNLTFSDDILLILSGLVTLLPMLGFNYCTNTLRLSTIGFLEYFGTILTMLVGVFVYKEDFGVYKMASFGIIIFAILLVSIKNIYKMRKATNG